MKKRSVRKRPRPTDQTLSGSVVLTVVVVAIGISAILVGYILWSLHYHERARVPLGIILVVLATDVVAGSMIYSWYRRRQD